MRCNALLIGSDRIAPAPRRYPKRTARLAPMSTDAATQKWICESCGLIYDPAEGDPDGDVPPGTPFEDIPEDWYCPVCGARKQDFIPYEE